MVQSPARPSLRRLVQHGLQLHQAALQIVYHIGVAKPHRPKAELPRSMIACTLRIGQRIMRIAIHFNHDPARWAEKV